MQFSLFSGTSQSQLRKLPLLTLLHREQSVRSSFKNNKSVDNKRILKLLHDVIVKSVKPVKNLFQSAGLHANYRVCTHLCSPFGTANSREARDAVIFSSSEKIDEVSKPRVTIG